MWRKLMDWLRGKKPQTSVVGSLQLEDSTDLVLEDGVTLFDLEK